MTKQLHRGFGFQPFLDALIGKGLDPAGELRFGNTGLYTLHFHYNVPGLTNRRRRFVHSQIVKPVKSPCFHEELPLKVDILPSYSSYTKGAQERPLHQVERALRARFRVN